MPLIHLRIDGKAVECEAGLTILQAARLVGLCIPSLCSESQDVRDGCGLCAVELAGSDEPVRACDTVIKEGMMVMTESKRLDDIRRRELAAVLAEHPQACLTCGLRDGCDRGHRHD
jgi:NADH dehydrogenase/NADH:ubiquinone oxidoreductase subunit G